MRAQILAVWVVGGAFAFAGAMAYAELAALRPHAGGEYVYLREAYGPSAAFLNGWTSFVAGFSGAIAASAIALADYVGRFIPAAADPTPLLTVPLPLVPLIVSSKNLVALIAIAVLTIVHVRGLKLGRVVQNVLAGTTVAALVVFVALGFSVGHGSTATVTAAGQGGLTPMLSGPDSGDVHLFWMERRCLRRRRGPFAREERAVGARPRDVDRHRHLPVAERAVSVRAAGRRPGCGARRPAHRHGGATAVWNGRRESPGRLLDRQHHGQPQRDDDCRTPRVLRHGPRRGICGAGGARASEVSCAHRAR